jgi:hypothetical protein
MTFKNIFNEGTRNIWFSALFIIAFIFVSRIDALEIIMVYAFETMIIGAFHVLKLLSINNFQSKSKSERLGGIGMVLFFIFHYGFFVFIQCTFFFVFLSMGDDRISSGFGLQNFKTVLQIQSIQIGLTFITILYAVRFYYSFIKAEKYKEVELEQYFVQPYLRIIIQQFVAIIPGFFIILFNAGMVVAIVLILIRAFVDSCLHYLSSSEEAIHNMAVFLSKDTMDNKEKTIEDTKILLKTFVED